MSSDEEIERKNIETVLGYTFADEALLKQALTHSTYANENPDQGSDNERLEFVGDAVLDLLATSASPDAPTLFTRGNVQLPDVESGPGLVKEGPRSGPVSPTSKCAPGSDDYDGFALTSERSADD